MKRLILILGANGIGKTTTSKALLDKYNRSAYIDADWCRAINPFQFTIETKKTVTNNIFCLIRNYLLCDDIDHVIFPYGFHGERKDIFDSVIKKLHNEQIEFELCAVILTCECEENINRMKADGRDEERIKRAIQNTRSIYDAYDYPKIDTTDLTIAEAADQILQLIRHDVDLLHNK